MRSLSASLSLILAWNILNVFNEDHQRIFYQCYLIHKKSLSIKVFNAQNKMWGNLEKSLYWQLECSREENMKKIHFCWDFRLISLMIENNGRNHRCLTVLVMGIEIESVSSIFTAGSFNLLLLILNCYARLYAQLIVLPWYEPFVILSISQLKFILFW